MKSITNRTYTDKEREKKGKKEGKKRITKQGNNVKHTHGVFYLLTRINRYIIIDTEIKFTTRLFFCHRKSYVFQIM